MPDCDICSTPMVGYQCKLTCPNCGARWDCSDLFYVANHDNTHAIDIMENIMPNILHWLGFTDDDREDYIEHFLQPEYERLAEYVDSKTAHDLIGKAITDSAYPVPLPRMLARSYVERLEGGESAESILKS